MTPSTYSTGTPVHTRTYTHVYVLLGPELPTILNPHIWLPLSVNPVTTTHPLPCTTTYLDPHPSVPSPNPGRTPPGPSVRLKIREPSVKTFRRLRQPDRFRKAEKNVGNVTPSGQESTSLRRKYVGLSVVVLPVRVSRLL